jgi:hypothetical protein
MIELGVIPIIAVLIDDPKKNTRKEVCWGLSNILAGPPEQLDVIFNFQEGILIKKLIHIVQHDDPEVF